MDGPAPEAEAPAAATPPSSVDLEVFKMVAEHFNQDLREFWVRNNMYLFVTGVLVSVFASLGSNEAYRMALPAFGLLISLFWFAVSRGSYQWLRAWRNELCDIDLLVDRFQVFHRVERQVGRQRKMWSASWITQWLPVAVGIGWLALLILAIAQA
jgi:hypothetical protein